jgi:hypothetical protein
LKIPCLLLVKQGCPITKYESLNDMLYFIQMPNNPCHDWNIWASAWAMIECIYELVLTKTSSNVYYKVYLMIVDEMIDHHWFLIQDWHYVYVVEGWKHIPILLTFEQVLCEGIVHNLTKMIIWQMCCKLGGILNIFRNFLTSSLILVQTGFQFFLGC